MKSKLETVTEDELIAGDTNSSQQEQYCMFYDDHTFYYWDYYKDLDIYDNIYNAGYKYSEWYIPRKYNNMKDEILNNKISTIDQYDYDEIWYKATKLLELSDTVRSMVCNENVDTHHYDIHTGSGLSVENIFCILIYTDYPLLASYSDQHLKNKCL